MHMNCDDLIERVPALRDAPPICGQIISYWVMGYSIDQIATYVSRDEADVRITIEKYDPNSSLRSDTQFANLQTQRNAQMLRDYALVKAMEACDPKSGIMLGKADFTKLAHGWRIRANMLGRDDAGRRDGLKEAAGDLEGMIDRGVIGNPQYYVDITTKVNELIKRVGPTPEVQHTAEDALDRLKLTK